jgi:hypothetical protein
MLGCMCVGNNEGEKKVFSMFVLIDVKQPMCMHAPLNLVE